MGDVDPESQTDSAGEVWRVGDLIRYYYGLQGQPRGWRTGRIISFTAPDTAQVTDDQATAQTPGQLVARLIPLSELWRDER